MNESEIEIRAVSQSVCRSVTITLSVGKMSLSAQQHRGIGSLEADCEFLEKMPNGDALLRGRLPRKRPRNPCQLDNCIGVPTSKGLDGEGDAKKRQ